MPALRHKVLITAAGAGSSTQDDDTGGVVDNPASSPVVIYDGKGFFLDQGTVVERDTAGLPTLMADGQIVLQKKAVGKHKIKDGMVVKVTYPDGDEVDMTILKAIRFTDIIYVMRA